MNQLTQAISLFSFAIFISFTIASLLKKSKWDEPIPDFVRAHLEEWGIHSIPEKWESKEQYDNLHTIMDIIKAKKNQP